MSIRLLLVAVAAIAWSAPSAGAQPSVAVRQTADGAYVVSARFSVPQPADVARAVLTDYEAIPRFMPDVRTSRVVRRGDDYVQVEQQAVSTFMFFSKQMHLLLDIREAQGEIRFRDLCGRSFVRYEGAWTIARSPDGTELVYDLTAKPAFKVPGPVLRKLLGRDANEMIARLRAEMAARALEAS